jgi:hypothetical protein
LLWETINWAVRNSAALWEASGAASEFCAALAGCLWLRDQPLFRALLQEAIRRGFTFPPDVFQYLQQYVLDRRNTLDGYTPWRDPAAAEQSKTLRPFLAEQLEPPDTYYGKQLRAISIGKAE